MIDGVLFHPNHDNVLLRCLEKDDSDHILIELHDGPVSGLFNGETTTHKVLRVGYYWPTLFRDRKCHIFQVNVSRERRLAFPLQPITI